MSEPHAPIPTNTDDENTVNGQVNRLRAKLSLTEAALERAIKAYKPAVAAFKIAEILREIDGEISQARCNIVSILEGGKVK